MKPRIMLTEEQLYRVAELRALEHTWSFIGRELGVHRQILKREYLIWANAQVAQQLTAVRQDVAEEEFRRHLDLVCALAQELVDRLETLIVSPRGVEGEDLFSPAVNSTAPLRSPGTDLLPQEPSQRFQRERRWVYDALQMHIGASEWKDRLGDLQGQLRRCLTKRAALSRRVNQAAAELSRSAAQQAGGGEQPQGRVGRTLVGLVWDVVIEVTARYSVEEGMSDSKWQRVVDSAWRAANAIRVVPVANSSSWDILIDGRGVLPHLPSEQGALEASRKCDSVVRALLLGDEAKHLTFSLRRLADQARPFVDQLDPIRLRPLLLRTRCYLCPA